MANIIQVNTFVLRIDGSLTSQLSEDGSQHEISQASLRRFKILV